MTDDPIPPNPRFREPGEVPDDQHADVNEVAGLLSEIFAVDMTSMGRACPNCHVAEALATHRVYHGAGYVARCPGCDSVAMRLGVFDQALTLMMSGVIAFPRAG